MNKIIGISTSPRKGFNTDTLVCQALAGAARTGAETIFYHLTDLKISPCTGCNKCRSRGICSQDDDMTLLLETLTNAQGLVVGSPIYMGQMSGQAKIFMDRLYPLMDGDYQPRIPSHVRAAWLFTQGAPDPKFFKTYIDYNQDLLTQFGFD
ncbi:MAG: flavodoxin family protein, partial [Desulfobacterales bacterium]|nr:flavodoxin family protein [Desulfobacterales bacterium]